jgi:uncharacterized protein YggU (UPF0235/DUF167 family)
LNFFAKLLKVPRGSITIARGQTTRMKTIRIADIAPAELRRRLEL